MSRVSESIFDGKYVIIPMAEVVYIEKDNRNGYEGSITVVLSGSTWNQEIDAYNNIAYLQGDEARNFLKAWCFYRFELEGNIGDEVVGDPLDMKDDVNNFMGLSIRPNSEAG